MNTNEKFVITISRELGSGGHTIAQKLAEKMGVRLYDKELIKQLSERFNLNQTSIERLKAQKKNWMSDFVRLVFPAPAPTSFTAAEPIHTKREYDPEVTTDDIFLAETEILRGLAEEGSCVIAGRSGFHVFKNHPNTFNVFISASLPHRISRVVDRQGLTEDQAAKLIRSIDLARENYIQRYAGVSRYDARNYDLALKADGHSEEQLASIILACL